MNPRLFRFALTIRTLLRREEGQDLIEYALAVALLCFAATVGMRSMAVSINNGFSVLASKLSSIVGQ